MGIANIGNKRQTHKFLYNVEILTGFRMLWQSVALPVREKYLLRRA